MPRWLVALFKRSNRFAIIDFTGDTLSDTVTYVNRLFLACFGPPPPCGGVTVESRASMRPRLANSSFQSSRPKPTINRSPHLTRDCMNSTKDASGTCLNQSLKRSLSTPIKSWRIDADSESCADASLESAFAGFEGGPKYPLKCASKTSEKLRSEEHT